MLPNGSKSYDAAIVPAIKPQTDVSGGAAEALRFGWSIAHPHLAAGASITLLLLLESGVSLALPWLGGRVANALLAEDAETLWRLGSVAIALLLLQFAARIASRLGTARIGDEMLLELRLRTFDHLQHLPMLEYERRHRGDLLSLLTTDAQTLSSFLAGTLPGLAPMLATLFGALLLMAWLRPELTFVIVLTVALAVVAMKFWMRAIHRRARAWFDAQSHSVDLAEEAIELLPVTRAAACEDHQRALYLERARRALDRARSLRRIHAPLQPAVQLAATLGVIALVLIYTGPGSQRPASPGELVTLLLYGAVIAQPLAGLADVVGQWNRTRGALGRIVETLACAVEPNPGTRRPPIRLQHGIRFESIRFGYDPSRPVFEDFDLEIGAGERVALTGANGCGKSTLVWLLLRYYPLQQGRITIDGVDIRDFELRALRRAIAIVPQRTWLFEGTIADNIRYAQPEATDTAIAQAARMACAAEFIEALPDGYRTELGARGSGLSGGQQQRIALARALLRPTPILVLDEATSMFDEVGEDQLLERLEPALADRSLIMITHRPKLLALADRIVDLGRANAS